MIKSFFNFLHKNDGIADAKDITEKARPYVARNYFLILLSNTLTTLGDTLSNPKTVLAWVMNYVQAPVALISFIVPIRESGSMLPQIIIASYVKRKSMRKWIWIFGSLFQFLSIMAIGWVVVFTDGVAAGWLIILFLITFSLSRGFCSIVSKDVLGKTIPKAIRGRQKGYTGSISGILVLIAGMLMIYRFKGEQDIIFYRNLLFFASCLWVFGAIIYANIKEFPGEISEKIESWASSFAKLSILREEKPFRDFIISRSLLLCSALSAPFYVVLAQRYLGNEGYLLGLFIIANGVASIISSPIWGKMADRSSRSVMVRAAIITSLLGIFVFVVVMWIPSLRNLYWFYPVAFFILGIAHSGVRLGRKTYIVNMASGNQRTDYVSISNTIIGIILLITGGVSALASMISVEGIVLILSLLGLGGAVTSSRLPEVEQLA
jgi:MFS family permease